MDREMVQKKAYLWNMVGSICYSLSSFYYMILVTRICGVEEAGVFSLAFATAQLLLTIGRFGVRTYQATDLKYEYSFREYLLSRGVTSTAMVLGAVVYVYFNHLNKWKASIFIWVSIFKMVDAIEDVFHGEMQRRFRVDLMGKMLAFRNMISCVIFTCLLLESRNLEFTCEMTAIMSVIICCLGNAIALRGLLENVHLGDNKKIRNLLCTCFPIFLSTFLSLYLYNVPKYAIDHYMEVENQAYYGILFMPSFVITLFSEIITKPLMTTITMEWERDIKKFINIVVKLLVLIVLGTICVVVGGHFIGRYLLELIYSVDLSCFKKEFVILLIGGGSSASAYVLYNLLIAIRYEKYIIYVYGFTSIVMTGIIYKLVKNSSMIGAAMGYLLSCGILCIVFTITLILVTYKQIHKQD